MLKSFRFHHIGIAVKSIEKTAGLYEQGGYARSKTKLDPVQKVNICWLTKEGMPTVELIEPVDENSPVCQTLGKNQAVTYHTCYEVEKLDLAIKELRGMRYVQVSEIEKAPAMHHSRICFLFNKLVGLIELVEAPATIVE